MGDGKEKYSFSRIETFHNCRRNYFHTYIEGKRSGESIYTYLGTVTHELTQAMIRKEITNQQAMADFIEAVEDAEMLDLKWISENVKNKYVDCIVHFLENYNPINNDTISIEDYFEINIDGEIVRGYIDLWYMIDKRIYIEDFKTSTKFSKKDLVKKRRQLLLYGISMSEKYPDHEIILRFNMLKYVLQNGKLVERTKVGILDEFEDAMVYVEFDEELITDTKEYVTNTIYEINQISKDDIKYWSMDLNPQKDFFCKHLCGHQETCLKNINKGG
ncbi:MAG: PD-(D/E)XK nuclease family protein [Bacillaceae bacterium]